METYQTKELKFQKEPTAMPSRDSVQETIETLKGMIVVLENVLAERKQGKVSKDALAIAQLKEINRIFKTS